MYEHRWLSEASTCPTCRHSLPSQHHEALPEAYTVPPAQPSAPQPAHPEGVESHQHAPGTAPGSGDSPEIADAAGAMSAQGSNSAAAHMDMGARAPGSDSASIEQQGAGQGASGHVHQFYQVQRVEGEEKWECNHNTQLCNATSGLPSLTCTHMLACAA